MNALVSAARSRLSRRLSSQDSLSTQVEQVQADPDSAWRALWPVLADPAPGIAVAMPLVCVCPDTNTTNLHTQPPLMSGAYAVRWIGWAPGSGIKVADTLWRASRTGPRVPQHGWTSHGDADISFGLQSAKPCQSAYDSLNPFSVSPRFAHRPVQGLYMPRSLRRLCVDRAGAQRLRAANYQEFLTYLPPMTGACMDILHRQLLFWMPSLDERTNDDDDFTHIIMAALGGGDHKSNRLCQMLDLLLGGNPAPGISVETASLRRCQFVLAQPALATELLDNMRVDIDLGKPVVDLLARQLGASSRVVRALLKVDAANAVHAYKFLTTAACVPLLCGMADDVLRALPCMGPAEWAALASFSRSNPYSNMDFSHSMHLGGYCRQSRGYESAIRRGDDVHYLGSSLRLVNGTLAWLEPIQTCFEHLSDMAKQLVDELVKPCLDPLELPPPETDMPLEYYALYGDTYGSRDIRSPRLATAILQSLGVRKLSRSLTLHLEGDIHDARLRMEGQATPAPGLHGSWRAAFSQLCAPNAQVLRCLTTRAELDHEGTQLGHCVASYAAQCRRGYTAIVSIGTWTSQAGGPHAWQPTSTFEVSLEEDGGLQVVQHRARRNQNPTDQDKEVLAWWLAQHGAGTLPMDRAALLRPSQRIVADRSHLGQLCRDLGSNWCTPGAHAHRWDRWRRLLDTRARSFSGFLAAMPEQAQAFVPHYARLLGHARDMDTRMGMGA